MVWGISSRIKGDVWDDGRCIPMVALLPGESQSVSEGVMLVSKPLNTGLPQVSWIGPFAFPAYSSPLFHIARKHGMEMYMNADDTRLYLKFKPQEYN